MAYRSVNPYTGQTVAQFDMLTDEQLEGKLIKAYAAFASWSATSFEHRAEIMNRAADLMTERREAYGRINTIETGKPIQIPYRRIIICVPTSCATTRRMPRNF